MRVASLLVVLLVAKAIVLAPHHVPWSWWSPPAYLWQDAVAVIVFAAIDRWVGRRSDRAVWIVYAGLVVYVAIDIPVTLVLATPLTVPMLRAARGPLADSISSYATWSTVLPCLLVLAVGTVAPLACRRVKQGPILVALVLCAAAGPAAVAHVDTLGLERNPWIVLVATAMPRTAGRAFTTNADWRASAFDESPRDDLSRFRGAAEGRNIVLVGLESTAAQYLGLYGADPDVMPHLSALARSAIVFDRAYAVYPESIKGLFSVLCSAYPALDSRAEAYAAVPCPSIAGVLAASGYRTALFHSGRFGYLGMEAIIRNRGFDTLVDAGDISGQHNSSFGVDEPSTIARMLTWIDALPRTQRFFITYLPVAGHHPYETPEPGPFDEHDEIGRYRNALHYGDASLGAFRRGLQARGLDQHTMWVVFGDHGEAFGQHDGNFGHTFQLYEENVRVPFLVAVPDVIPNQIRSRRIVSLVDTAPTLLDLAGRRAPDRYRGRSMLDATPRTALFFADYSLGLLGLRDGRFKCIYDMDAGRSKLFDLDRDPLEAVNLATHHVARVRQYERNLLDWAAAQQQLLVRQ